MGINQWVASDEDYPDHSKYLWHLTKDKHPLSKEAGKKWWFDDPFGNPSRSKLQLGNARDRLISILTQPSSPNIWCSHLHYMLPMFHKSLKTSARAVCFTECIPHSLPIHAQRFERYGLLFEKAAAYKKGVRPVWYLEIDILNRFAKANNKSARGGGDFLDFPEELLHLLVPFVPKYGNKKIGNKYLDFMVEREWRIGSDFSFSIPEITAIIVPKEEDISPIIRENPEINSCNFVVVSSFESEDLEHKDFDKYFVRL